MLHAHTSQRVCHGVWFPNQIARSLIVDSTRRSCLGPMRDLGNFLGLELYCMNRKWEKRTAKTQSLIADFPYRVNDLRASAWLWSLIVTPFNEIVVSNRRGIVTEEYRFANSSFWSCNYLCNKGNRRNEQHRAYISRCHRISRSIRQVSRCERRDEQCSLFFSYFFCFSIFVPDFIYWILQYQMRKMRHYADLFFRSTKLQSCWDTRATCAWQERVCVCTTVLRFACAYLTFSDIGRIIKATLRFSDCVVRQLTAARPDTCVSVFLHAYRYYYI